MTVQSMAISSLLQIKPEVLAKINIRAELDEMGIKTTGHISNSGWLGVYNPHKKDEVASCGIYVGSGPWRGFLVAHNDIGPNGKPHRAIGFFDLAADFLPGMNGDYREAIKYYAKKYGISVPKSYPPPTEKKVEKYHNALTPELREKLFYSRGLNDETINKNKLGYNSKQDRISIPVYDAEGDLKNIRQHNSVLKPKTLNTTGFGEARLYGVDKLAKAQQGSLVALTEGELDSLLVTQKTGLLAVSPTNGCAAFKSEWIKYFHGHHVILVWDCDQEGRKAVRNLVLPAFKKAIQSGDALSISVIWLFDDDSNKDRKDFTDFIVKAGGTGDQLMEMIEFAPAHEYTTPSVALPDPVGLKNFAYINDERYAGKRVTVPLYVYGENSEAYSAPTEVEVTYCPLLEEGKCKGREGHEGECEEPIKIRIGDRVQLSCVRSSDPQMKGYIREYICDRNKRPAIHISDEKKITLTEVYAHQIIEGHNLSESNELIEKAIYIASNGKVIPIGKYLMTGFVHANTRNQQPTLLVDTWERLEDDWQAFEVEKYKLQLQRLKKVNPLDLIHDFINVTKIYERDDLHLGTLLSLCSPRWINMQGDGEIRGRVTAIIIGDSGTGKSTVTEKIFNYANIGFRVSGMTSSRTGITYGLDHDEKRGWRIKAGALLKMSRQALIVDEAQDLEEEDLKTMAEAIDTGQLRIARIETRTFESETRVLIVCNPRMPGREKNQRILSSFRYGCTAIQDIFPQMMIRRIDLCLFAGNSDIKDKSKIYDYENSDNPQWITRENLQALIYYAWNLTADQIIISKHVAQLIRQEALRLSDKFGKCEDLPIIHPEDFRKTFCRLVAAFAIFDLASDDDFQTITVAEEHVFVISNFITKIYTADNCRLDKYSKRFDEKNHLKDPGELLGDIKKRWNGSTESEAIRKRYKTYFDELGALDPYRNSRVTQQHLTSILSVTRQTIGKDMEILLKNGLVDSSRGYRPTAKMIMLIEYLEEKNPEFWDEKRQKSIC